MELLPCNGSTLRRSISPYNSNQGLSVNLLGNLQLFCHSQRIYTDGDMITNISLPRHRNNLHASNDKEKKNKKNIISLSYPFMNREGWRDTLIEPFLWMKDLSTVLSVASPEFPSTQDAYPMQRRIRAANSRCAVVSESHGARVYFGRSINLYLMGQSPPGPAGSQAGRFQYTVPSAALPEPGDSGGCVGPWMLPSQDLGSRLE